MTLVLEAALCVVVLPILKRLGLAREVSGREAVLRLGVARSHAYEVAARLPARLAEAARPVAAIGDADELRRLRLRVAVAEYRLAHAGSWVAGGRTVYSDELRTFVLDLATTSGVGAEITQADFAAACGIPLATLKDWWASPPPSSPPASEQIADRGSDPDHEDRASTVERAPPPPVPASIVERASPSVPASTVDDGVRFSLEMCRILREYNQWQGSFAGFVSHLRELGLRYGKTWLTGLLYLAAARELVRRPLPIPAARGSTFRPLPGLQWTSDGKQFDVVVDGQVYTRTWQPMLDVGAVAFVGAATRREEDTAGVLGAFQEGVQTTGEAPAAVLLDNKACNKSAALVSGLPERTFVMHATRARPQNKAAIEGSFGLFAQDLGPVLAIIDTSSRERLAETVGEAVTRAYAQGRNRRPRRKDGMTPVDLYRSAERPPEVVAAHIEQLRAIKLRIDTREAREAARRDPRVIATLEHACLRFSFVDDGDVLHSLYRLSLEAIQSAIAVYAAKRDAGSLPLDAGLRYFAGIARNCQTEIELRFYEGHLVDLLQRTDDLVLGHLERKSTAFHSLDLAERLLAIVDELLIGADPVSQVFWRHRLLAQTTAAHPALREALRRLLCRRIRRHYRATKAHRQQLVDLVVRAFTAPAPAAAQA